MAGFDIRGKVPTLYEQTYNQGKAFRKNAFVAEMQTVKATENDQKNIEGLSQGRMQCFATCFTAWARLQGLIDNTQSVELINKIDRALGNSGSGVSAHLTEAVDSLPVSKEVIEEVKTNSSSTSVSAEYKSITEIENGRDQAKLLKSGGALILQTGGHFRLGFVDNQSRLMIYDPIGGSVRQISHDELYNYVEPEKIGSTVASVVLLPKVSQDDDFRMVD